MTITKKKIYAHNFLYETEKDAHKNGIKFSSLGKTNKIKAEISKREISLHLYTNKEVITKQGSEALCWINAAMINHLKASFNVDCINSIDLSVEILGSII